MRSFTIVSRPNYQDPNRCQEWMSFFPKYNKKFFPLRLTADNNHLGEAVKKLKTLKKDRSVESGSCLELTHPKSSNLSTVCIWKHEKQPNKYYVKCHQENISIFDRLADRLEANNLLYLPTLRGKQLIDFRNISNFDKTYRYQVIEPEKLGFPNSVASKKGDCYGVFFKQVESDEGVAEEIIDLECNPEIAEDRQDGYHAVGWLNPVIFTLSLDENDIEYINNAKQNESLNALSLFIDRSALILVEPHIDESYDLRISFLIKLHQQSKANNKNLSLIEYILLGSQDPQPWKPFLILDLLGGEFYAYQAICQNNECQNRDREKTLVGWKPPQDAQSNKLWFADYWLIKWGNSQETNIQSEVNVVPQPSLARPYRSSRGLVTFQVDNISEATSSLTSLLSKHPRFISDRKKNNPYRFLVELFADSEFTEAKKTLKKFPYDHFLRIENQNNQLVKFDDVDFWNYFSKSHIIPKSRILIAIPNQDNRFLDPINSVNFGAYRFLWGLFNSFDGERKREIVDFYNKFGWWNNWHSTIFNERWDVWLNFINRRGFVIQKSRLGQDYLGQGAERVDWKDLNMRFSGT